MSVRGAETIRVLDGGITGSNCIIRVYASPWSALIWFHTQPGTRLSRNTNPHGCISEARLCAEDMPLPCALPRFKFRHPSASAQGCCVANQPDTFWSSTPSHDRHI